MDVTQIRNVAMGTMGAMDQYSNYVELLQMPVDCPEFADAPRASMPC